eukprot:s3816_g4.t1
MSSVSTQIVIDDELMEYEIRDQSHGGLFSKRPRKAYDAPPMFQVIHDCPRPRSESVFATKTSPAALAQPVEPAELFIESYLVGQSSPDATKTRFGTEFSPNCPVTPKNAKGAASPDNAPTEIDQETYDQLVDGVPSEPPAGLEPSDDSVPGTLKRKLQFDAAACGLGDDSGSSPKSFENDEIPVEPHLKSDEGVAGDSLDVDIFEDDKPDEGDCPMENLIPGEPALDIKSNEDGGSSGNDVVHSESPTSVAPSVPNDDARVDGENKPREYKTTEKHRSNSNNWHKKWVSKGVPRPQKSEEASSSTDRPQNLAKAKDSFISQWIKDSNLPPSNERRKLACKAWMESQVRADLMAGRAGIQK